MELMMYKATAERDAVPQARRQGRLVVPFHYVLRYSANLCQLYFEEKFSVIFSGDSESVVDLSYHTRALVHPSAAWQF